MMIPCHRDDEPKIIRSGAGEKGEHQDWDDWLENAMLLCPGVPKIATCFNCPSCHEVIFYYETEGGSRSQIMTYHLRYEEEGDLLHFYCSECETKIYI